MQVPRDENRTPAILGVLNSDGITPTSIYVNSANHRLKVSDGSSGAVNTASQAVRDENRITGMMAVSATDGVTLVPLAVDSLHRLLIKST